jgi:hypothetical protein
MPFARMYCGLALEGAPSSPSVWLAVVDGAGRLFDIRTVPDDATGYTTLATVLAYYTAGLPVAAVAADREDIVLARWLTAAGHPVAFADDALAKEVAERLTDHNSPDEHRLGPAGRRAVGLARALHGGLLTAVPHSASPGLDALRPLLATHAALVLGRQQATATLREILRELYPAALRAFPDPGDPLALAVLDLVPAPDPTGLSHRGYQTRIVEPLLAAGAADRAAIDEAVTRLWIATAETPRPAGTAPSAVSAIVRQSVAAVRSGDGALATVVALLAEWTPADRRGEPSGRPWGRPDDTPTDVTRPAADFAQPPPGFAQPPPAFARPPADLAQPPAAFTRPSPDFAQPPPGFAQPPAAFTRPSADFAQPPPDLAQPLPGFAQPPPGFTQPSADFAQPPPDFAQPPPGFARPAAEFARPRAGTSPYAARSGPPWPADEPPAAPPVAATSEDSDLLIFGATRSAWFTRNDADPAEELTWANAADAGWQAAARAARPAVGDELASGLPLRVPERNLVPGSAVPGDDSPIRPVRDPRRIAAGAAGYFRGWRRGREARH